MKSLRVNLARCKILLAGASSTYRQRYAVYRVMKEEGPDHDKTFTLGVYINDHLKATGVGHSKQEAQVKAAAEAIRQYKREHPKEFSLLLKIQIIRYNKQDKLI